MDLKRLITVFATIALVTSSALAVFVGSLIGSHVNTRLVGRMSERDSLPWASGPYGERSAMSLHRAINFQDKLSRFTDHWAPKVVAQMNDYQLKLVKIQGEFVWHSHADTDEVFIVLEGRMRIELRDGAVDLGPGEMFVVPKGGAVLVKSVGGTSTV